MLELGSNGPSVALLQHNLNVINLGIQELAVDSSFGPKTAAIVRQFQFVHGLGVDGIVGPLTQAAIDRELLAHLPSVESPQVPAPAPVQNLPTEAPVYPLMAMDKNRLSELLKAQQAAGVTYGFGSKDPTPKAPLPINYKEIDCSGEVREFVYYTTDGVIFLPDGSQVQKDYFESRGYKRVPYTDTGLMDGKVRGGVYTNPAPGGADHIWLTYMGQSFESHGGVGPSNRPWNHPTLKAISGHSTFFELA